MSYERTTPAQQKAVCSTLSSAPTKPFPTPAQPKAVCSTLSSAPTKPFPTTAQPKAVCSTLSSAPMQPFPAVDYNPLLELSTEMVDSWLGDVDPTSSHSMKQEENPTIVRQEDDPPSVKEEDGIDARVKEEASDLMKKLQFNHITSCTFNINFKM